MSRHRGYFVELPEMGARVGAEDGHYYAGGFDSVFVEGGEIVETWKIDRPLPPTDQELSPYLQELQNQAIARIALIKAEIRKPPNLA